jgi:hypothetical protein
VQAPREIQRGRNKGRIEVEVNKLRKVGNTWKPVARPVILEPNQIIGYEATT